LNLDQTISVTQNWVNDNNLKLATQVMFNFHDEHRMLNCWMTALKEASPDAFRIVRQKFKSLSLRALEIKYASEMARIAEKEGKWKNEKEQWIQFNKVVDDNVEELRQQLQDAGLSSMIPSLQKLKWSTFMRGIVLELGNSSANALRTAEGEKPSPIKELPQLDLASLPPKTVI